MSSTVILINLLAAGCLTFALFKNREKTKKSMIVAVKSFFRILPLVLVIIIIVGLFMAFIPPSEIMKFIGDQAGWTGILAIAALGAVLHIPALISYPLAAALLQSGAAIASVAAFITTLTMVGVITLHLEIKELGLRFTLLRNGLSFVIAVIIALIMGIVL
ncbi:MAG TPA: permease [Acidobacteriota bacterium]|nr:permease [Acidobacteriota bacterium]